MEQGNVIQVFRYRANDDGARTVVDIWEIGAASSVNALSSIVTDEYTDGKDDTYEVITVVNGVGRAARPLCWDTPPRCRKERLCVVLEPLALEDFKEYCTDFFS